MTVMVTKFNADVNVRDYSGRKPGYYLVNPAQVKKQTDVVEVGASGRHFSVPTCPVFPDFPVFGGSVLFSCFYPCFWVLLVKNPAF